jgi:DNA-binding transcriptional LysR family regulator
MNLRRIDLNLLTVFDAVMQEGNLTRAANKIGMSQPAVSDAVSRLRHVLKDELFIRTSHGMKPTPRAQQYAGQVKRILDLVTLMLSETESFDVVTSERVFNLVLGDYGELVILPALMQYLDDMQAGISVNVLSQHRPALEESLRTGAVDFIVTPEPIVDPAVKSELVTTEKLVSMVRRDHPQIRDAMTLEQFVALRHVVLEWPDDRGSMVDQRLRAEGMQRNCHMRVHSFFDMPRVVASTDMVCSIPSQMAYHFATSHKLTSFPIPLQEIDVHLYLNWYSSFDSDPGIQWLKSAITALLEGSQTDRIRSPGQ